MKLVLLGPPGAGKGLQAKLMTEYLHIPSIATGEMFRQMADEGNPLGIELRDKYFAQGLLVPDEITTELLRQRLEKPDCKKGFILDGYPRSVPQAESLEKITKLNHILLFEVLDEEIIDRLSKREICKPCGRTYGRDLKPKKSHACDDCGGTLTKRDDDNSDSVRTRLKVYREKTKPVIDFYLPKGLLKVIDGNQSYQEVAEDVRVNIGAWTI